MVKFRPGHLALPIILLAGVTACSQREEQSSSDSVTTVDAAETAADGSAAPGIAPTAAPGVAFTYRYGFRLPDDRVAAAQEAHAAACEKLGLARCRITGMTYELDSHERVQGSLELAIDPLIARGFGKDAVTEIERQDGKLRYTRIDGEDQNPALDDAARREGSANSEIAKLEAELRQTKSENERVQLREQIRQLRAETASANQQAASAEARIQRTPMTFTYEGGSATGRGFAGENPAKDAWYLFVGSMASMITFLLKAVAVLLPWVLVIALLTLLWRSHLFDWARRRMDKAVENAGE